MKFALVDGIRTKPLKGLSGICQGCERPVVAKCGQIRRHHWAHESKQNCSYFRERETDWHRFWKDNFPEEWQEVLQRDEVTGEKHIADIQTDFEWTIEFQNSYISEDEKESRNDFYPNLVWVVNALKIKKAHKQLRDVKSVSEQIVEHKLFNVYWSKGLYDSSRLIDQWHTDKACVIFDYGNKEADDETDTNWLWLLMPYADYKFLVPIRKTYFIRLVKEGRFGGFNVVVKQEIGKALDKMSHWLNA